MKSKKLQKQMQEVLDLSKTSKQKVFSICFTEKDVLVNGVSDEVVKTQLALVYSSKDGKQLFSGHVNQYNLSDNDTTITIAFDVRKDEKPNIFLAMDDSILKINSKSPILPEDIIIVYWEYGYYSFLSLTFYDPIVEKVTTECVFSQRSSSKGFCRHVLFTLLPEKESSHFRNMLMKSILQDDKGNEATINE